MIRLVPALRASLTALMLLWAALPSGPARAAALAALCCPPATAQAMDHGMHGTQHGVQQTAHHGITPVAVKGGAPHDHGQPDRSAMLCDMHCLQGDALRWQATPGATMGPLRPMAWPAEAMALASLAHGPVAPPPKV